MTRPTDPGASRDTATDELATTITEEPIGRLAEIAAIPIAFVVDHVLEVSAPGSGTRIERPVDTPWVKDYDATPGHAPGDWAERFDVANWGLLAAYDGPRRVGAAVVAHDTPGLEMLEGRRDLAVLWDLRIHPDHRHTGIGTVLFQTAAGWAAERGCTTLRVETQNINVPACRFYRRMGCTLVAVHPEAYPGLPGEVQLIWELAL